MPNFFPALGCLQMLLSGADALAGAANMRNVSIWVVIVA